MAAMPFPCNDILVVVGNLPRIFPMSSLIYASFFVSPISIYYLFLLGMANCFTKFGKYFILCQMLFYMLQL